MLHNRDSKLATRFNTPFIVVLTYLVGFLALGAITLSVILASATTGGLTQAGAIILLATGGAVFGMAVVKLFFPEAAEYDLLRRNADVAVTVDAARGNVVTPAGTAASPTAVATAAMQHAIKYQRAAHVKVISAVIEPIIIALCAIGGIIGLARNDFVAGQITNVVLGCAAGGFLLMEMYFVSQTRLSPFMARNYWASLGIRQKNAAAEHPGWAGPNYNDPRTLPSGAVPGTTAV